MLAHNYANNPILFNGKDKSEQPEVPIVRHFVIASLQELNLVD